MTKLMGRTAPYSPPIFDGSSDEDLLAKSEAAIDLLLRHEDGFSGDGELIEWIDSVLNLLNGMVLEQGNSNIESLRKIVSGGRDSHMFSDVFLDMRSSILNLKADSLLDFDNCKLSNEAMTRWVKKIESVYEVK